MIDHISIKDFAIIDNAEVDFEEGLSIITGETGSGKSILVTAISLALGSRADSSYVRNGKDKAIVQLKATLNANTENEEEIVISREISPTGKNLCKINGSIVTLSELNEKCKAIADIHGQYDNQSLLDTENHILILDNFCRADIGPILLNYRDSYDRFTSASRELKQLLSLETENTKKADFYRYEIDEIDQANVVVGEDNELKDRLSILQNSEKIFDNLNSAYEEISGSSGAYTATGKAIQNLESISQYSDEINSILDETNDIYYKFEDMISSIRNILDKLSFDPKETDLAIERLDLLETLKKKYSEGTDSLESVLEYRDRIAKELSQIDNYDVEKERLTKEYKLAKKQLYEVGALLSDARKLGASKLSKRILEELKDLNFLNSDLSISIKETPEPTPNGMDDVEILISTNLGEPLKPLAKTASGGEISRVMLAIKNVTSQYDDIPTMIFDEIDQGISGKTAAIVGRKLKEISKSRQVICITHLPQIAAKADTSYRIYKESDDSMTYTHIERLNSEEQIVEIARLLGGETITETALANAKELLDS